MKILDSLSSVMVQIGLRFNYSAAWVSSLEGFAYDKMRFHGIFSYSNLIKWSLWFFLKENRNVSPRKNDQNIGLYSKIKWIPEIDVKIFMNIMRIVLNVSYLNLSTTTKTKLRKGYCFIRFCLFVTISRPSQSTFEKSG